MISYRIPRTVLGHKLNLKPSFKSSHHLKGIYQPADPNQVVYPIVDLREFDNQILNQEQEGDCTAASSGGVWMYLQILKYRLANPSYTKDQLANYIYDLQPVSMDMIYSLELSADGDLGQDAGSTIQTSEFVLSTFGATTVDFGMANDGLGYEERPTQNELAHAAPNKVVTYQIRDLKDLRTCHSEGYPGWLGIPVYPSFANSQAVMQSGVIPMPQPFEQLVGGHAIKTIGHNDNKRTILLANSWGTAVGQNGYFELPYDYFEQYCNACATARLP